MILNLTIDRQGLPPARVRWNTTSFTSTHNASSASATADPTIAELIGRISEVIPLEAADWGLEDYAIEVNGYECLHFCRVSQVLKDEDRVHIRPLQTQEVRFRALSGRDQISADGRHLIDGVSFGRPFIRRGMRPAVRIAPKRGARVDLDYDDQLEDEPIGLLTNGHPSVELNGEPTTSDLDIPSGSASNFAGNPAIPAAFARSVSQGGQPLKRRLEPAFEDARSGKRVRSALQPPMNMRQSSRNAKNVSFSGASTSGSADATPSTIHAPLDSDDEDEDDDFDPAGDDSDSASDEDANEESETEANKENINPEPEPILARHILAPSTTIQSETSILPRSSHGSFELPAKRHSSLTTSSPSSSEASLSSDSDSGSDSDAEDSEGPHGLEEDSTDSDDDSSSSGSDSSEVVSEEPIPQSQTADTSIVTTSSDAKTPPGMGKVATKTRNKRRRNTAMLKKLQSQGRLGADASLRDLRDLRAAEAGLPQRSDQEEFELKRQALLYDISNGGVEVSGTPISSATASKSRSAGSAENHSTAQSSDGIEGTTAQQLPMEVTPPEKRRRLDMGASQRLLLGGLGLRVPKSKADEEAMREKSRLKAQKEVERHQKRADEEKDSAVKAPVEENWQNFIEMKSVECMDPTVQYTTPPFPFQQRWDDPQQNFNLWRPHARANKKKKKNKRKYEEANIEEYHEAEPEEYYDATMYDDPPEFADDHQDESMRDAEAGNGLSVEHTTQPPLDVADEVDLLVEHALTGAKIAFKHYILSKDMTPGESDYRVATVTSNEDGYLTLQIDEYYQVHAPRDEETGEIIGSNFIVADAHDEDEGVLEIEYSDLIQPKLLVAAVTPKSSQVPASSQPDSERPVNLIDALANISQTKTTPTKSHDAQAVDDDGEDTAVETSFNASTTTAIGMHVPNQSVSAQQSFKSLSQDIDADMRAETSMLIRGAGFRSSIDPEATRPLEGAKQAHRAVEAEPMDGEGRSQSDVQVFSSFRSDHEVHEAEAEANDETEQMRPHVPSSEGGFYMDSNEDDMNDTYNTTDIRLDQHDPDDELYHAMKNNEDTSGRGSSSIGEAQIPATQIDIINLEDSSQEMVTEVLQQHSVDTAAGRPDSSGSVIHRPSVGNNIDLAKQIITGDGALASEHPSRQVSPDAAPIEPEDVQEIIGSQHNQNSQDSQESLPAWESFLEPKLTRQTMSQPNPSRKLGHSTLSDDSASDNERVPMATNKAKPKPKANMSQSVAKPKNTYSKAGRRVTLPATQPEANRNTRRAARRATAMANPISLLSDDDDADGNDSPIGNGKGSGSNNSNDRDVSDDGQSNEDEEEDENENRLPASTAPARSFQPINRPPFSASQPNPGTRRKTMSDAVDLTHVSTDITNDSDSEDDESQGRLESSSFSSGPKGFFKPRMFGQARHSSGSARTKSFI